MKQDTKEEAHLRRLRDLVSRASGRRWQPKKWLCAECGSECISAWLPAICRNCEYKNVEVVNAE